MTGDDVLTDEREMPRSIDVGSRCRRPYINSSSSASPIIRSSSSSSIDNDDASDDSYRSTAGFF